VNRPALKLIKSPGTALERKRHVGSRFAQWPPVETFRLGGTSTGMSDLQQNLNFQDVQGGHGFSGPA
jgi:hypothetical protein